MPTDKQRIDWLEKESKRLHFPGLSVGPIQKMKWGIYNGNNVRTNSGTTLRKAIDTAMLEARKLQAMQISQDNKAELYRPTTLDGRFT